MGRPRSAPALLLTVAIVTLVVSIVGLVGSIMVNAFALDKYDAYGEVPIPGAATLHLPAGEVAITLHTYAVGAASGGGLPIPELGVSIDPPPGVADPDVVENIGATTSVNNDIRRRVWIAHIPAEGNYRIRADGKFSAFIEPRLAFGHGSTLGWLPWVFGALLAVSIADLVISMIWLSRRRSAASVPNPPGASDLSDDFAPDPDAGPTVTPASQPMGAYTPTDEGVRIEQIKHLAALRDSGALTQREFEQEKRRVLDGS